MKIGLFAAVTALVLSSASLWADETNTLNAEFQALIKEIHTKLDAGKESQSELADEVKRFEGLLNRHRDEKTDDVAHANVTFAMLQMRLGNSSNAIAQMKRVKAEFPETAPARDADRIIDLMESQARANELQAKLRIGSPFPDFAVEDLNGKRLALADFKGKVTLIDFWATWCGPCIAELPHVIQAYEKYHAKGFEIIGVSLDQESDRDKLKSFLKQQKMPWSQFFDGKGWNNQLAQQFGIQAIPATFLLDRSGKIIGKDLRGEALDKALAAALAAK